MSVREWFKEWFNSPYYHKLYFERDEKEAQQFIQRLLDLLSPQKEARMLDVACGRGRHSRFLASLGYDVTGIDISPDSIHYAQQFEADTAAYVGWQGARQGCHETSNHLLLQLRARPHAAERVRRCGRALPKL